MNLEQRLGHWAARLSWAARQAMERRLRPLGLSPPMLAALSAIEEGATRASDVARVLGVDAAGVTRMLDRLSSVGLLERCDAPGDRRSRKLSPTPKALALLPKARDEASALETALGQGLSPAQKKNLLAALKRLTQQAEKL